MKEDFWIPRNLDASPLFFIWELDIAMVYVVCFTLGAVLNMFLLGTFFAVVLGRGYARLKEEGGKGLIMKVLYWYTPSEYWLSKYLPSHVRAYFGG
jgi:conjugal transfer pilus assembly protein TraL